MGCRLRPDFSLPLPAPDAKKPPMIKRIPACRISGSRDLASLIDLGEQYLTDLFPTTPNHPERTHLHGWAA